MKKLILFLSLIMLVGIAFAYTPMASPQTEDQQVASDFVFAAIIVPDAANCQEWQSFTTDIVATLGIKVGGENKLEEQASNSGAIKAGNPGEVDYSMKTHINVNSENNTTDATAVNTMEHFVPRE